MELLENAVRLLREADYEVWPATMDSARVFENDTVLGFVIAYATANELLRNWGDDSDRLIAERQFQLRAAGQKSWNCYLVLLANASADEAQTVALSLIEEDLGGTRKIARAGCTSPIETRSALLPLFPLQASPVLDAVDSKAEIRQRTTEISSMIVDAFLSSADAALVLQLMEEAQ